MAIQNVAWATAYLLLYHALFILGFDEMVAVLFAFSPVVMGWMVWRVLKDPFSSEKTWEKGYLYLDQSEF